jgi:hypothetical protein
VTGPAVVVRQDGPSPARSPRWGLYGAARDAVVLVADHAELWPAGALAYLAFLGWLPFTFAVVSLPNQADLGFFLTSLVSSQSYPLNVFLLAGATGLLVVGASVMVVMGEAALQRAAARVRGREAGVSSLDDDAARFWLVQLLASIPALGGTGVLLAAIAVVAPNEYQSPDLGLPLIVRVLRDVWPFLAGETLLVVVGQVVGGPAQRAVLAGERPLAAVVASARDLVRDPMRRLGLALASDIVLVAWLAMNWALLRVLWLPIGQAAARGALLDAAWVVLLVGFVAIWICLIAAGGALHAAISGWWTEALDRRRWS